MNTPNTIMKLSRIREIMGLENNDEALDRAVEIADMVVQTVNAGGKLIEFAPSGDEVGEVQIPLFTPPGKLEV